MRSPRQPRRDNRGAPRVRSLLALALAACLQPASGQTVPGGAGYQMGTGSPSLEVPRRRGEGGWATEASFTSRGTLTNNANYGDAGPRASDLILELIPALSFNRQGGRLRVDGNVALDMIGYVNDTQVSRILPRANVLANLEAIDDFFYVDGSLNVSQSIENPFLPSSSFGSTNNLYTTTQVRVAPYLKGNVGPLVRWQVRSDNTFTWTSQASAPLDNAYYVRNLAEVVRVPTPLGLTLRLTNDFTRQQNQVQPDQTLNTALAIVSYAVNPQLTVGLRGGYENTTYTATETSGAIYGADIAWNFSPITRFSGYWEQRFYGPSYQYEFTHRQRRVASTLSGYRTVTTYPQVLLTIPPTSSVAGLLDAILVARFPDPIERAQQTQELITRQGLPPALPGGTTIYNQGANILTGFNGGWALIGVRNTLGLNLFYLKTELLPDARVPPSFTVFNDNVQQGASISLSHRITPVVSLNGTISNQTTRGINLNDGLKTREGWVSAQTNWQVSPRSTLFVGARYQRQNNETTTFTTQDWTESAVFAGLFHRL